MAFGLENMRAQLYALIGDRIVGWCGQRTLDCVGLSHIYPVGFVVSCDYGQEITELEKTKKILSVESLDRVRKNWSNDDLELAFRGVIGAQLKEFVASRKVLFICYRSAKFLEEWRRFSPKQCQILASPVRLKDYFDDKLRLYRKLPQLGFKVIPGEINKLSKITFYNLARKYGLPFVIQLPIGSSGNNTFFIFNETEFNKISSRLIGSLFKVSKYLPSYSINVNAVIYGNKILLSFPSIQIIGVRECATRPAIFCGNDFGAAHSLPDSIVEKTFVVTQSIGSWMASKGYRGIFGVDLLVSEEKVYAIEINPRFQNSTDVLTISQYRQGQVPLVSYHLLEFLDKNFFKKENFRSEDKFKPQSGAQIILHNLERKRVRVHGQIRPGVYLFFNNEVQFQRVGYSLLDCRSPGEFLITCAVPYYHHIIEKGAPLLKIQTYERVLDSDLIKLNEWASNIVKKVYQMLDLQPEE